MLSTDIAVGAPYDDMGKVFIYHGAANGINTKPTQVTNNLDFHSRGLSFLLYKRIFRFK